MPQHVSWMARLAAALLITGTGTTAIATTLRTSGGDVVGVLLPTIADDGGAAVEQYLGIPFATASRFQPPVDFEARYPGGAIEATMWGPACTQVGADPSATYGSDDCLRANVWRPVGAAGLPVMVFIYGGSNQFGEAEPYNMSAMAAFNDVVCVSFNYRTGPIGWMAFHEDVDAGRPTGNWGILDIQSALRWVRREAAALGGDASRLAIFGQSSGAGLVELQYVAPGSAGLFRAAISESGDLAAQGLSKALASSAAAGRACRCLTAQGAANKTCLAAAPAQALTQLTYSGSWGPTVDGVTFPRDPQKLLEDGEVNNVTIVLGSQTNDSNLFLFRSYTKDGLDQPNDRPDGALRSLPPLAYDAAMLALVGPGLVKEALHLYPVDKVDHVRNVHLLGSAQSDRGHCSARRRASLFGAVRPGRAFTYRFDYWYTGNPNCTAVPNFHLPYLGAAHQDEVTFVLGQPNFMNDGSCCGVWGLTTDDCPHLDRCQACYDPARFHHRGYRAYFTDQEWGFSQVVRSFWTNAAASGDPNCKREGCPDASSRAWAAADAGGPTPHNIVLNATLPGGFRMEATPHGRPELCDFWDRVAVARGGQAAEQTLVV